MGIPRSIKESALQNILPPILNNEEKWAKAVIESSCIIHYNSYIRAIANMEGINNNKEEKNQKEAVMNIFLNCVEEYHGKECVKTYKHLTQLVLIGCDYKLHHDWLGYID